MKPKFGYWKIDLWLAVPLVLCCLLVSEKGALAVGTPSGTTISNTATTTYQDASSNNYTANSNTVSVTVNSVFTVSANCAANMNANSNTIAYYACSVTNTGNAPNTFALTVSIGSGWTAQLLADDGAGGGTANDGIHQSNENTVTASTGSIVEDATYKFFLAVSVPGNTANGTTAAATVNIVGSGDPGTGDDTSVSRTTTAQAPGLVVQKKVRNVTTAGSFATSGVTAKPTEILEYQVQVTNSGTVTATNVVLQDTLDPNVTYLANSIWAGSSATYNGGTNSNKTDAAAGDGACVGDSCAAANFNSGTSKVTFYLGNGATESTGGNLATSSTVYVYYRVTVK